MRQTAKQCQWRPGFFAALAGVAVWSTGCGKSAPPAYDRVQAQLVHELFQSLADGKDEAALRQVGRLEDAVPGHPFVTAVGPRTRARAAIKRVNELLAEGELTRAREFLMQEVASHGTSPELDSATEALRAVAALDACVRTGAHARSETLAKALAPLARHEHVLSRSATYSDWLTRQKQLVDALRKREHEQALREAASRYDEAVLTLDGSADACLEKLLALDPESPGSRCHKLLLQGTFDDILSRVEAAVVAGGPAVAAVEVTLFRAWPSLPPDVRSRLAPCLTARPPDGALCGMLLRAETALDREDIPSAVRLLESVCRQTMPSRDYVGRFLTRLLLPREQFLARPWRVPFPSATDLLNRVTQLREYHR